MTESSGKKRIQPTIPSSSSTGEKPSPSTKQDFFSAFDFSLDSILDQGITSLSKPSAEKIASWDALVDQEKTARTKPSVLASTVSVHPETKESSPHPLLPNLPNPVALESANSVPVVMTTINLGQDDIVEESSLSDSGESVLPQRVLQRASLLTSHPMSTIQLGFDDILSQESSEDLPVPSALKTPIETVVSVAAPSSPTHPEIDVYIPEEHEQSHAQSTEQRVPTEQTGHEILPGSQVTDSSVLAVTQHVEELRPQLPGLQVTDSSVLAVTQDANELPSQPSHVQEPESPRREPQATNDHTTTAVGVQAPSFLANPRALSFSELPVEDVLQASLSEASELLLPVEGSKPELLPSVEENRPVVVARGRGSSAHLPANSLSGTQQILLSGTQEVPRQSVEVFVARGKGSSDGLSSIDNASATLSFAVSEVEAAVAQRSSVPSVPQPAPHQKWNEAVLPDAAATQNVSQADIAWAVSQQHKQAEEQQADLSSLSMTSATATLQVEKQEIVDALRRTLENVAEPQAPSVSISTTSIARVGIQTTLKLPLHEVQAIAKAREDGLDPSGMSQPLSVDSLAWDGLDIQVPDQQRPLLGEAALIFPESSRSQQNTSPEAQESGQPFQANLYTLATLGGKESSDGATPLPDQFKKVDTAPADTRAELHPGTLLQPDGSEMTYIRPERAARRKAEADAARNRRIERGVEDIGEDTERAPMALFPPLDSTMMPSSLSISSDAALSYAGSSESAKLDPALSAETGRFSSKQLSRHSLVDLSSHPSADSHDSNLSHTQTPSTSPSGAYSSRIIRTRNTSTQFVLFLFGLLLMLALLTVAGLWFFVFR